MNNAEMKVEIFEFVTSLKDEQSMSIVYSKIKEAQFEIDNDSDWWDDLSPEQQQRLEKSLEDSYDEKNLIDHEDAKKMHARWLRK
jgi:hypothetical protein